MDKIAKKPNEKEIYSALSVLEYVRDHWSDDEGISYKANNMHCIVQELEKDMCEDEGVGTLVMVFLDEPPEEQKMKRVLKHYKEYVEREGLLHDHVDPEMILDSYKYLSEEGFQFVIDSPMYFSSLKNFYGYLESRECWVMRLHQCVA